MIIPTLVSASLASMAAVVTLCVFLGPITHADTPNADGCLADDCPLSDTVTIGILAPISGGAQRYGADIYEAALLAASDFNYELAKMEHHWSLNLKVLDTQTDPLLAFRHIQSLNEEGITIVGGPSIDLATADLLDYASDHDMLLLGCCTALPSTAIPDDAFFRLVPDHHHHASSISELIAAHDTDSVILAGLDSPWITELLESAKTQLESRFDITADVIVTYPTMSKGDLDAATAELADVVQEQVDTHGSPQVAVLYAGFEETADFMRSAAAHDILWDVRWFGADINTKEPNLADDDVARDFAQKTGLLVVHPDVADSALSDRIERHVESRTGIPASAYANFAYDVVWLLGLSISETGSADAADAMEVLPHIASGHDGVTGPTILNQNGDSAGGIYAIWGLQDDSWVEVTDIHTPKPFEMGVILSDVGLQDATDRHRFFAIQAAIRDFNDYLKNNGIYDWEISASFRESHHDPGTALREVQTLHDSGVNFIVGPSDSGSVMAVQEYAQGRDLAIVSCCSTSPELAIQDNVFRLAPSDESQGKVIASMLYNDGKTVLIPVWADDPFGRGLVGSTAASFEGDVIMGEFPSADYAGYAGGDSLTYVDCTDDTCNGQFELLAAELNRVVIDAMIIHGPESITIQYVGADLDDFVRAALGYDALRLVSWVGSDADTLSPHLVREQDIHQFLTDVDFKSGIFEADTASMRFKDLTVSLAAEYPDELYSTYAYSSYDAVWAIGLAVMSAGGPNSEFADVDIASAISHNSQGALGTISLNEYGDLAAANYAMYGMADVGWHKLGVFDTDGRYVETHTPATIDIGMLLDMSGRTGFNDRDFAPVMSVARHDYDGAKIRLVLIDTSNGILPALNMLHQGAYDGFYHDRLLDIIHDATSEYSKTDGFAGINDQYQNTPLYPVVIDSGGMVTAHGHDSDMVGLDIRTTMGDPDRNVADIFSLFEGSAPPAELWWQYVTSDYMTGSDEIRRVLLAYHAESGQVVGSGYSLPPDDHTSAMDQTIDAAVSLIISEGGTDVTVLGDTFNYDAADTPFYAFVMDVDGNVLASAAHNDLNSNIATLADIDATIEEINETLSDEGDTMWIIYKFNNPATDRQETKHTLLKLTHVGDSEYIFGAGYYPVDKLSHFVGPTTSKAAQSILEYISDNDLVVASPSSTATALAIPDDGLFRFTPSDKYRISALVDLLKSDSKSHIVLVYRDDVWGRGMAEGIRAEAAFTTYDNSGNLLLPAYSGAGYDTLAKRLASEVNDAISNAGVAEHVAVLYAGFGDNIELFAAIDRLGDDTLLDIPYYGTSAVDEYPEIMENPAVARVVAAAGFSAVSFDVEPNEINTALKERLEGLGITHTAYSNSVYDTVHVLARAIEASDADGRSVADIVASTAGYRGALNGVTLDAAGDLLSDPDDYTTYRVMENGEGSYVWQVAPPACDDDSCIAGNVQVGVLLPLSGQLADVGSAAHEATELAVADFNAHLQSIGQRWQMVTILEDTQTDPQTALKGIATLDEAGADIILGPILSANVKSVKGYVDDNDMLLVSCCSSTLELAINDNIYRLAPDGVIQMSALAGMIQHYGLDAVASVYRNDTWGRSMTDILPELLDGVVMAPPLSYDPQHITVNLTSPEFGDVATSLSEQVQRLADAHGAENVAVVFLGFTEVAGFMDAASHHEILDDVRWFGTDATAQNTALVSDVVEFADAVAYTAPLYGVTENDITARVLSNTQHDEYGVFAYAAYDAVWLVGKAILEAQDTKFVGNVLPDVAGNYSGALGRITLNDAGDLVASKYDVWAVDAGQWTRIGTYDVTDGVFAPVDGH